MLRNRTSKSLYVLLTISGLLLASIQLSASANAISNAQGCAAITQALVVGDGFTKATAPVITAYNYAKSSANAANSLGTTFDFGAKALVVGCVSPSDIAKLSISAQAKGKPTMTATQYMAFMVKDSAGAMKKTAAGPVTTYLDFGNGKEDGLGSTAKAKNLRLDAWVVGNYIILTFSAPASVKASAPLLAFMKSTKTLF